MAQGVPGSLRPRIFLTFGTTRVVGRQQYAPAVFTPGSGLSQLRENYRGINPYKTTILNAPLQDFKGEEGGGKQKISKYFARDRSPKLQILGTVASKGI